LSSFGAAGLLREGEEVCAKHHVDYHSISGFFDFHADLFDSCGKCFDASAKQWCCLFRTFYRHEACC
jgi:hypothetical protein